MNGKKALKMNSEFIKIPLTIRMKEDYEECARMMEEGKEKDCEGCSLNGGAVFECIGEYPWCRSAQ